ncbi:MAG: hypothetical protein CMJ46_08135 [Planctomyces sp.]|nr:hypothetical protein [Planctomyces sp.]
MPGRKPCFRLFRDFDTPCRPAPYSCPNFGDRTLITPALPCSSRILLFALLAIASFVSSSIRAAEEKTGEEAKETEFPTEWVSIFDGKTLDGWKATKFGGEGEVFVKDGALMIKFGADLSGANYTKPTPENDYEVELEAKRVDGSDFFCGLTFPVDESPCTLIVGGWGGGLCGLSSINGNDASENKTTSFQSLENDRWYKIRLRVEPHRIQAWIDDEQIVNAYTEGDKLSIRSEVSLSKPFGISTWQTTAALKNIRIRKLTEEEAKPAE